MYWDDNILTVVPYERKQKLYHCGKQLLKVKNDKKIKYTILVLDLRDAYCANVYTDGEIQKIFDINSTVANILITKNTFIIVTGTMALQIPVCVMVAYALSKLHSHRWNRILFLILIGPLLVPMVANLIPTFLLISRFPFATKHIPNIPFTNIPFPYVSLKNSFWAIILPTGFSAFNTLLLKGFFDSIPDELVNAARLDGASELGIIRRIILPLSKPVLAVVTYFTFSIAYNNFLWPLIVLKAEKWPLSVFMYRLADEIARYSGAGVTQEQMIAGANVGGVRGDASLAAIQAAAGLGPNAVMAISLIQSIPVFIMFIVFREQLMKGIKLRGFK